MKLALLTTFLLVTLCLCIATNAEVTPLTSSILGLTSTIIKLGFNMIEDRSEIDLPISMQMKERKILRRIEELDRKISNIGHLIDDAKLEAMYEIVSVLTRTIKVELRFNDLLQFVDDIDHAYSQMQEYASRKDHIDRSTMEDFAKNIVSHHSFSVNSQLERVHRFIVPRRKFLGHSALLDLLASTQDLDSNSVCMSKQSPNQLLYNLYNTIALTQIKGYAMMQFSYTLLELYKVGSFSTESQLARDKFINRSLETAEEMKTAMERASTHFWKCDPDKYVKDENYLEITQLLQGYVQNEVDLNPDGTCKESCGYYQFTKSHSCFQNLYCRQQRRCKGRIFNCRFVDSDMWICPAAASTGRRYNYIEYENGRILGQKQSCPNNRIKVDSWWRWLFWHCSYCMCLCDEEGIYSDRYFSLLAAESNLTENKIVTGLRFTKKNRIIHLQIQQGTLLRHGVVDESSLEWVPVSDMKITDRFIYNRQQYFTLSWENRALDLDVLQGDNSQLPNQQGFVLTGVKFKLIGSHLNFEIRVTPFDFESGKLYRPNESSEWRDNPKTEYSLGEKRSKILLGPVDVPTRARSPNVIRSTHNQFLEFMHTDFDKDAAQTTVPFLDAQPVVPIIPMPLAGAGIYFKSASNHGGFIGLKVLTYNFGNHLDFTLPTQPPELEAISPPNMEVLPEPISNK